MSAGIISAWAVSLMVGAAPAPAGSALTEAEVVQRGLAHLGIDIMMAQAGAEALATADAQTSFGATSLSWSREQLFGDRAGEEDSVLLSQPLEISGRAAQRAAAARQQGAAARHDASALRSTFAAHLRADFHRTRLAAERTAVLTAWRDALGQAEERVEARVRAGDEAAWANTHSHHELARAERRVALAELDRESAQAHLAILVGWSVDRPLPTLTSPALPTLAPGGVETYVRRLEDHPEARAWAARVRAGELRQDAGERAWVPGLDLSLGYKTAVTDAGREHGYAAGVSLSLPLSGDPGGEAGRGRAQASVARSGQHLWATRQEARVRQAYLRTARLVQVAAQARAHLDHGHGRLLASARLAYEGGELDLDGLLEAHGDARDDRLEAVDLAEKAWEAHIELERLTGGLP